MNGHDRGGRTETFEFFKKRLKGDAKRMSRRDIEELDRDVPRKLNDSNLNSLKDSLGWVEDMIDRVKILFRMIRDSSFKVDFKTKALVGAALAYFVLPTDMIPDFIPGVGYIDDALVLSTLWRLVQEQIDKYLDFLDGRHESVELPHDRDAEIGGLEMADGPR